MQSLIEQFSADESLLKRMNPIKVSPVRREKLQALYASYLTRGDEFSGADGFLLRNLLEHRQKAPVQEVPTFAVVVTTLEESRLRFEPVDPMLSAQTLADLARDIDETAWASPVVTTEIRAALGRWFGFYSGYDPLFTWWTESPYRAVEQAFDRLTERNDTTDIPGTPVGRDALLADLAFEMIPYSPEELIAMAEEEYAWCESEMKRAAGELGFGDDWKRGLEHVKSLFVPPGEQPALVHKLAREAVEFIESRDLITLPQLLKDTWGMEMMSAADQKVNPFFLGGESIVVSFPTHTMTHGEKMMSLRGNNPYFSRATVQHELIPGHQLQAFMEARHRPYRQAFTTPFWIEGWALYWEMRLWNLGFAQSPEERIGMLFWRMHRCVRVTFSLGFHLGQLRTQECVEMLVDRVGHERLNAEGEVRRSFNGSYPPLYQAAYLIGGFQFMALHHELVDQGSITEKEFHDAVLRQNNIPVSVLRSILLNSDTFEPWRFRP